MGAGREEGAKPGESRTVGTRLMAGIVGKAIEPVALEFGDDRGSTVEPARCPLAGEAVGRSVDLDHNRFTEPEAIGDCQSDSQAKSILRIERSIARVERPAIDSHEAAFVFEARQLNVGPNALGQFV